MDGMLFDGGDLSFIDRFSDILECGAPDFDPWVGAFESRELEIDPNFKQIMPDHAT